jgi:hypothetical protein
MRHQDCLFNAPVCRIHCVGQGFMAVSIAVRSPVKSEVSQVPLQLRKVEPGSANLKFCIPMVTLPSGRGGVFTNPTHDRRLYPWTVVV